MTALLINDKKIKTKIKQVETKNKEMFNTVHVKDHVRNFKTILK